MPDAYEYGDEGANTLIHIAEKMGGLNLPNMAELGLGNIDHIPGVPAKPGRGVYGIMRECSKGKDTTTGHWEIAGIILEEPFRTYPNGFPKEVIDAFEKAIGRKVLGNVPASGTVIIQELGEEHMKTGKPIVYTSADSVFQIAAHEEIIPVEELYEMCRKARKILTGPHAVGRVIARPFVGTPGNFTRTERREDFSLEPPKKTILDLIKEAGLEVMGVGKIEDIFAKRGLTQSNHTVSNMDSVDAILDFMVQEKPGLIFANLVEFDMVYGHRNNVEGYARALEEFDGRIPELIEAMKPEDVLIITADHGCDPTHPGTDHTREQVPVLIFGKAIKEGYNIGVRESFADLGATVTELLGVPSPENGESFAKEILK
ncbi:phosphopentomutase [Anoxybacter fermentans]|uniref:Phosphopentomutase n=2 Tax=Anoxybacter fermentans TaxID=1323375 RepID=A0A3S9T2V2_9FIRM|nr:phosphopentomutase [Anoxybacter fermentans]